MRWASWRWPGAVRHVPRPGSGGVGGSLVYNRPAAVGGAVRACGQAAVAGLPSAQSLVVSPARRGVRGWRIARKDVRCRQGGGPDVGRVVACARRVAAGLGWPGRLGADHGLMGAVVLVALAGARRTDTAVSRFLQYAGPTEGEVDHASPRTMDKIAACPASLTAGAVS